MHIFARIRALEVLAPYGAAERLAMLDRQFRTLRNHAFRALNPFVSRRFAWQLSGLVDRSSN